MMSSFPSESNGIIINDLLGADRFYIAGITGQSAIAANVEPGHIWPGHETLGHVTAFSHHAEAYGSTTADLYDRHATWVGMIIGGRKGGTVQGDFQTGISPGVDLRSGAFNTAWTGSAYSMSVNYNWNTFTTPFNTYFGTADVINSSWAGGDPAGTYTDTILLDSMVYSNPRTTYVVVAGNAGPGTNTVGWPGSGYNAITVGALGGPNAYDSVASFSSRGPQDYSDPINGTIAGVRAAVDISAPGTNIKTAYYGGQTGGNNPSLPGSPSGIPGDPSSYTIGLNGSSLAAPTVTGGAALLASASYNTPSLSANPVSRDGRVIKAVLLNSAHKTSGWDNGQTPFGAGVQTTQSLDYQVGAGRLDLDRAYDQYLSGTTDLPGQANGNLGQVQAEGWDFGRVIHGTDNDYYINTEVKEGTTFAATLTWFRDRTSSGPTVYDNGQSDLDLIVFDATGGTFAGEVSRSISDYNVVEHLYFTAPLTGYYGIRVRFDGALFGTQTSEEYGLAWRGGPGSGDGSGDGPTLEVFRAGFETSEGYSDASGGDVDVAPGGHGDTSNQNGWFSQFYMYTGDASGQYYVSDDQANSGDQAVKFVQPSYYYNYLMHEIPQKTTGTLTLQWSQYLESVDTNHGRDTNNLHVRSFDRWDTNGDPYPADPDSGMGPGGYYEGHTDTTFVDADTPDTYHLTYGSADSPNDSKTITYTGCGAAAAWVDYRAVLDLDAGTFYLYIDTGSGFYLAGTGALRENGAGGAGYAMDCFSLTEFGAYTPNDPNNLEYFYNPTVFAYIDDILITWAGPGIFGDANDDSLVDSADLAIWQQNYDPLGLNDNTFYMGDWNADGFIDSADLALWQQYYDPIGPNSMSAAHVPEPATLFVMMAAGLPLLLRRRRNRGRNPELASGLKRKRPVR